MTIDFEGHRILLNNKTIYLTHIEKSILEILYENIGKVVKYDKLIKKIYNIQEDESLKNALRKNISILRRKIGNYINIHTIKNVGYIIEEELQDSFAFDIGQDELPF